MDTSSKKRYSPQTRILRGLLAGFTVGSLFFFFGVLEIFAGNRKELLFSAGDFVPALIIATLAATFALAALIIFLPGKASDVVFGLSVWLAVMGYVQGNFLNGAGSLVGDGTETVSVGFIVADTVIWAVIGAVCITGALLMRKIGLFKSIMVIALIMVLTMQIVGCATQTENITKGPFDSYLETTSESTETTASETTAVTETTSDETTASETTAKVTPDIEELSKAYLTTEGLCNVSRGKNIVIFLLDRFDVSYYNTITKKNPEFFYALDGFTYFGDNISLYSRTYPAVATMITGVDNPFDCKASKYFYDAYTGSQFLKDLKANDYKIKLYTANYYAYSDGTPFYGLADNLSIATDYTITDKQTLVENMLLLSAYRYVPTLFKSDIKISTASFAGLVDYNGDAPLFELNDCFVYNSLRENGLSFDDSENSYTFIHLNACHDPYNMDEAGNYIEEGGSPEKSLQGCFRYIYDYIDEMKRLGVYDDATIVITGDHPRAMDDCEIPAQPRLTALFVKEAGSESGKLKTSAAQVSQANLIPTLVKSAGLRTNYYYGKSYFDIPEGENTERFHNFELYVGGDVGNTIVTLRVTGKGTDFANWEVFRKKDIGTLYK